MKRTVNCRERKKERREEGREEGEEDGKEEGREEGREGEKGENTLLLLQYGELINLSCCPYV